MPSPDKGDTKPKDERLTPENPAWICIESNALHWDLYFFLGEGDIAIEGGGGGWSLVERPEQVALVDWAGYEPWRLTVPIMLDGWVDGFKARHLDRKKDPPGYLKGRKNKEKREKWKDYRDNNEPRNIEKHVDLLIDLSRPAKEPPGALRPRDEPPPLRVYGKAIPFWLNGHRFVIENIDWNPRDMPRLLGPGEHNKLRRQALNLTLLQHVDEGYYKIRKRKKKKGGGGGKGEGKDSGKKTHTVRQGETAIDIAAREYGDPTMWRVITNANGVRNPRKLVAGQELKIP